MAASAGQLKLMWRYPAGTGWRNCWYCYTTDNISSVAAVSEYFVIASDVAKGGEGLLQLGDRIEAECGDGWITLYITDISGSGAGTAGKANMTAASGASKSIVSGTVALS